MNSMLSPPESPRGARVLDSLADALMKLFGDLLASSGRVDTDAILTTVTSTIAEQIPVTCIAILMKSDPDMSRVVTADRAHPEIAEYIDDYIATLTRPREAPTAGFSQRVIEAGAPLFVPRMEFETLMSVVSPAGKQYVQDHPAPIANAFTSLLMVPMHAGPATVGTLGLFDWYASGVVLVSSNVRIRVYTGRRQIVRSDSSGAPSRVTIPWRSSKSSASERRSGWPAKSRSVSDQRPWVAVISPARRREKRRGRARSRWTW